MRRLNILAEPHVPTPEDSREWIIADGDDGLAQVASFARGIAAETGEQVVYFEVLWPWETEADNVWDALEVDVSKIDANDPGDWWVRTLPPYDELTPAERVLIGLPDA
jgi:hypothetical protein